MPVKKPKPSKWAQMRASEKPIDCHVGARVRMVRLSRNMSQETLADKIGLTFQQVQKYEKGVNRISASRMHQIAGVLSVPPTFFFEGEPLALDGFLATRDGLRLARAFGRISTELQRAIVRMVEQIAEDGENGDPSCKRGDDRPETAAQMR